MHVVPRPFTLRCTPAVFHPSTRYQCEHTAVGRFIQTNALPRLECVRHHRLRTGGLTFPRVEVRSHGRVHTRQQLSRKAIGSRHSRITEIQLSQMCGTSETPRPSSGPEIISGMQTISEMQIIFGIETISETETVIFVLAGKNMFLRSAQGVGITTGTVTVAIGGMVTGVASLMDRG